MSQTMYITLHLNVETYDKLQRVCSGVPGWTPPGLIRSMVEAMEPHLHTLFAAMQPCHAGSQVTRPDVSSALAEIVCETASQFLSMAWCCECGQAMPDEKVMPIPGDGRFVCYSCCAT